ncbi:Thioesterase superfamily protein [Roseivivax jejudonensis]|uniref:Thioesterase superfamily protein n=1 Tax=Roseivivax jejudonensis TaxID=1529041 RepID=A0A1X7A8Z8_9RHOB|nr:PaaI family thioesterase [Roseivivax jejudonensis]SLN71899.1 Thioesterase superfamily protein [Roseivivax jejudonensis]
MTDDATARPKTGLVDPETALSMTGLDFVAGMGEGTLPMPPIFDVMPVRAHHWDHGSVEFRSRTEPRFANPMGTTHGGWIMTMLDTAMAVAAHTTLAKGETYTSIDTSVRFVRPIPTEGEDLRIVWRVLSRGRKVITVEGRLEAIGKDDASGKLCATGTSSCMVIDNGRSKIPS